MLGIGPALIAKGNVAPTWQFRDRRKGRIAEFDLALIGDVTHHPYRLQCEQFHLTELLRDALRSFGHARVEFSAPVTGLTQDGDGVDVEIASGRQRERASLVVGADGGRSAVRKVLPIEFEGFTYEERIIQAGTPFDFRAVTAGPGRDQLHRRSGGMVRAAARCRLLAGVVSDRPRAGRGRGDSPARRFSADCTRSGKPQTNFPLVHRKCWRVHQRVASDFRHGRVALAGDAAHVNSPHGGMGMNSAIHEAQPLRTRLHASGLKARASICSIFTPGNAATWRSRTLSSNRCGIRK